MPTISGTSLIDSGTIDDPKKLPKVVFKEYDKLAKKHARQVYKTWDVALPLKLDWGFRNILLATSVISDVFGGTSLVPQISRRLKRKLPAEEYDVEEYKIYKSWVSVSGITSDGQDFDFRFVIDIEPYISLKIGEQKSVILYKFDALKFLDLREKSIDPHYWYLTTFAMKFEDLYLDKPWKPTSLLIDAVFADNISYPSVRYQLLNPDTEYKVQIKASEIKSGQLRVFVYDDENIIFRVEDWLRNPKSYADQLIDTIEELSL